MPKKRFVGSEARRLRCLPFASWLYLPRQWSMVNRWPLCG